MDEKQRSELLASAKLLVTLLEDPHPGLASWLLAVATTARSIAIQYDGIPRT